MCGGYKPNKDRWGREIVSKKKKERDWTPIYVAIFDIIMIILAAISYSYNPDICTRLIVVVIFITIAFILSRFFRRRAKI